MITSATVCTGYLGLFLSQIPQLGLKAYASYKTYWADLPYSAATLRNCPFAS